MVKKIFVVFVLLLLATIGLYAIGVLTGMAEVSQEASNENDKEVDNGREIGETFTENVSKIFNFNPENQIEVGRINHGREIMIEKVNIQAPGFVVVYSDRSVGSESVLGYSRLLPGGETEGVRVGLRNEVTPGQKIYIGLKLDGGNRYFELVGGDDQNVTRADNTPILEEFIVN